MKRKILLLICCMFINTLNVIAMGNSDNNEILSPSEYKIVLLLPGPINDQSWNAANYGGLIACNRDLGTNIEYVENINTNDFEQIFRSYAEKGYHLIMAAGTQFDEAANSVAQYFPDTKFCVVNGMLSKFPNVTPIFPKEYEASFLAGIIASYITEEGTIASVGGFPNRAMIDLLEVYEKTVSLYAERNRNMEITAYRDFANSWDDVSLGKTMAEEMIGKGADVLFFYANQVGLGAIQAAKANNIKFIGFSSNQNNIAPETVVASIAFDFGIFYKWALNLFLQGELEGKINLAGIKEGIFIPYYTEYINDSIKNSIEIAIEQAKKDEIDFETLLSRSF